MAFPGKTISSLVTDPLFSTVITLCILILLYFPTLFLGIIFSPVLISTSVLLLSLLRLGAIQRTSQKEKDSIPEGFNSTQLSVPKTDDRKLIYSKHNECSENGSDWDCTDNPSSFCASSFVEWDVRAPLEVIYEEYEGQGEEEEDDLEEKRDAQMAIIERYASLSKFYPETDSDTSSEDDFPATRNWDSSENVCFRWEGEDRDGLIEIALEGKGYGDVEEENLIEIDLYPTTLPAR